MSKPRLLVIDDNALNLRLAQAALDADGGFEVELESDPALGWQKALAARPHVVLLDIYMPRLNGLTLMQHFRQDKATARSVIIAFTAYAMENDEKSLLDLGFDGYISKPIDALRLGQQVRDAMRAARRSAQDRITVVGETVPKSTPPLSPNRKPSP